jgi:hypothetical protein
MNSKIVVRIVVLVVVVVIIVTAVYAGPKSSAREIAPIQDDGIFLTGRADIETADPSDEIIGISINAINFIEGFNRTIPQQAGNILRSEIRPIEMIDRADFITDDFTAIS